VNVTQSLKGVSIKDFPLVGVKPDKNVYCIPDFMEIFFHDSPPDNQAHVLFLFSALALLSFTEDKISQF
jgi:hypothetical protein